MYFSSFRDLKRYLKVIIFLPEKRGMSCPEIWLQVKIELS